MSLAKVGLVGALVVLVVIGGWKLAYPDVERSLALDDASADPVSPEPTGSEELESVPQIAQDRVPAMAGPDMSVPVAVTLVAAAEPPKGSLDARLVDEHGIPLPGAELIILRSAGRRGVPEVLARGHADASGLAIVTAQLPRYALAEEGGVAAASFELLAQYTGRETQRLTGVVQGDRVTHLGEVVLGPGAKLNGRVVDRRGVAVAGVRVGSSPASNFDALGPDDLDRIARVGSDLFDFLTAVVSRDDGAFDLAGLSHDPVRVWAHVPGKRFGLSTTVQLHPAHGPVDVEVVLEDFRPGDRVAGQVVGPDGAGRTASLGRMVRAGERSTGDSLPTDAEGRFSFEVEYLDAVYDLSATDPTNEFAKVQLRDIQPGDQEVVIAFRRSEPMLIHLRDTEGAPVLDANISIGIDGRYSRVKAESTEPGDYVIEKPTGRFALTANAPGFRELFGGRFEDTTAAAELNLVMQRALAVRGVVKAGGMPMAGAIVEVFSFDPGASMTVNGLRCPISYFASGEARTDANGRFELSADVGGPFVVRARHGDWVDAELGPLSSKTAAEAIELELSRGGTIEGVVLVASGTSPGGIVVAVHRGDGRPRSTRTAEDGSFKFENLMPGPWQVFSLDEDVDPHRGTFSSYQGDEPLEWDCDVQLGRATKLDLDLTAR